MRGRLLFSFLSAGLLFSGVARAEDSGSFTLETGSPDALCPALEVTREAVTRRLGALVVEGRKGWRARYTIGHAPFGTPRDFVRLELRSPDGRVELIRDLPIEGESCRTMAEVLALVLDRYFRGLVAEERRPPEAEPAPAELQERPRVVRAPVTTRPALDRRLALEYALTHPAARPWVGLRGSTVVAGPLELALGLRLALTPLQERAPRGATVEVRALAARSGLSWRAVLPLGLFHVGPIVSLVVEQATTQGLANGSDRARALWSGGLESGVVVPVSRSFFVQTGVSAEFLVGAGRFFIEEREVLSPPSLMFGWSLGIGYH